MMHELQVSGSCHFQLGRYDTFDVQQLAAVVFKLLSLSHIPMLSLGDSTGEGGICTGRVAASLAFAAQSCKQSYK